MRTGWRSRGYLPHIDAGEAPIFLTWRLADALPKTVIDEWIRDLKAVPDETAKAEFLRRMGKFLDAGHGSCRLKNPAAAKAVQDVLVKGHGDKYDLHAWVVMPNHVHCLLSPKPGCELSTIVQRLKGASARAVNAQISQVGTLWEPDYYDKLIRDIEAMERIRHYIEWNPVKTGLCQDPKHWPYSSANESIREHVLRFGLKSSLQADSSPRSSPRLLPPAHWRDEGEFVAFLKFFVADRKAQIDRKPAAGGVDADVA